MCALLCRYEERHQAQTVSQIKDYMKKLTKLQQDHKSLSTHIALCERIQRLTKEEGFHKRLECEQDALQTGQCSDDAQALVEDLCVEDEPLPSILRLLCLLSLICNGLRPKQLASLQKELNHAYGYQRMALTWPNLTKLGLVKKQEARSHWSALKKGLRLVVDGAPEHELGDEPSDLSYVHAGYAPLSVRLVHMMVTAPPQLEDMYKLLPGPSVSYKHGGSAAATATTAAAVDAPSAEPPSAPRAASAAAASSTADEPPGRPPVTLVVFLGGCTFAEIAALRWLGRNATPKREYLVATTHITNGDRMMEAVIDSCENGLEALEL